MHPIGAYGASKYEVPTFCRDIVMRKAILAIVLLTAAGCATSTVPDRLTENANASPSSIQVMVLGTHHFAGATEDLINLETDNVLTLKRQLELQSLSRSLATFKPTVIVTERETEAPDYYDPVYMKFDNRMLSEVPNERVQVGYRVARLVGIDRVYGLDEQTSTGEPNYFPFEALITHATELGRMDDLQAILDEMGEVAQAEMEDIQKLSIPMMLHEINTGLLSSAELYYQLMTFDEGESQPAAELQAFWFMRNAKIFSKLEDVTQPGDRVIIVYGAGHKFWLEHFVRNMPGFELVSPVPYLLAAE